MPFYQASREAKAAAIGTIMPWTGAISQIPAGWIVCDGSSISAKDFPLLARTIQDTYNAGISTFGGSFPNYTGEIVLPALINKPLCDIEGSYFGTGNTGLPHDEDAFAFNEISPYIGPNTDNGVPTTFNDVATDVKFTLNERQTTQDGNYYYAGKISGNTVVPGTGEGSKQVFFGPRKLGRSHIKGHRHGGRVVPSIKVNPADFPGEGVIPWSNVTYNFELNVIDKEPGPSGDQLNMNWELTDDSRWQGGQGGFGSGQPGRTVAGIQAENPPINFTPKKCVWNPIKAELTEPSNQRGSFNGFSGGVTGDPDGLINTNNDDARSAKYKVGGGDITIPSGFTTYYPDQSPRSVYDTFNSTPGWSFTLTQQTAGRQDVIRSHTHEEIEVNFDISGLKPETSLEVDVAAPAANLNLDNTRNVGVLQINFNTTQPGVTCLYLIRAY